MSTIDIQGVLFTLMFLIFLRCIFIFKLRHSCYIIYRLALQTLVSINHKNDMHQELKPE